MSSRVIASGFTIDQIHKKAVDEQKRGGSPWPALIFGLILEVQRLEKELESSRQGSLFHVTPPARRHP